jgi:hypothetical protein
MQVQIGKTMLREQRPNAQAKHQITPLFAALFWSAAALRRLHTQQICVILRNLWITFDACESAK